MRAHAQEVNECTKFHQILGVIHAKNFRASVYMSLNYLFGEAKHMSRWVKVSPRLVTWHQKTHARGIRILSRRCAFMFPPYHGTSDCFESFRSMVRFIACWFQQDLVTFNKEQLHDLNGKSESWNSLGRASSWKHSCTDQVAAANAETPAAPTEVDCCPVNPWSLWGY